MLLQPAPIRLVVPELSGVNSCLKFGTEAVTKHRQNYINKTLYHISANTIPFKTAILKRFSNMYSTERGCLCPIKTTYVEKFSTYLKTIDRGDVLRDIESEKNNDTNNNIYRNNLHELLN